MASVTPGLDGPDTSRVPPPAARSRPVPHTQIHTRLRRVLENAQDVVVILLMVLLLMLSLRALWRLGLTAIIEEVPVTHVLSDVILLLILAELYRLLIYYLREHRISVALAVEVTLVSVLREVMLNGAHESEWHRLAAISLLLSVLGGLLALERWSSGRRREVPETDAR